MDDTIGPMFRPLPVKAISQRNPKWASTKLGLSRVTIGGYGCASTSLAMLLNAVRSDEKVNPLMVNAALVGAQAYGGPWSNYVVWDKVPAAFPALTYRGRVICREKPATSSELGEIAWRLANGLPVILEVDMSPIKAGYQQHFVLAVGRESNGALWINDPWDWRSSPGWEHKPVRLCPRYGTKPEFAVCGVLLFDKWSGT
jgi:hypothetical protein